MDINAIPVSHGMDIDKWNYLMKQEGICFYDSKKGETPFYSEPNPKIKMYDVAEEHAMLELEAILSDEELKAPVEIREDVLTDNEPVLTYTEGENITVGLSLSNANNLTINSTISPDEAFPSTYGSEIGDVAPAQTAGPLTDTDVVQLEVEDPRGTEALGSGDGESLSLEENNRIDEVMNATAQLTSESNTRTSRRGPSVRARNNGGASFELTDDTE
jgi:hypothetical protein